LSYPEIRPDSGRHRVSDQLQLQSMVWPGLIFLLVFAYIPMYGVTIAFKEFNLMSTIQSAPWVGLSNFKEFFDDPALANTLRNTLFINGLALIFAFTAPIVLALLMNEIKFNRFKRTAQTISYLPHFLSWVIFGGIVLEMLAPGKLIGSLMHALGIFPEDINLMAKGKYFYTIYTIISIIKSVGFASILYIAAITGIDQEMYEAAKVDGCNRLQKMWYVTLPSIAGVIVIMFIFQVSSILNTGYEQLLLLQNPLNLAYSETIETYVYKTGIAQSRFSYATAVGVFISGISVLLMLTANGVSKKLLDRGLF